MTSRHTDVIVTLKRGVSCQPTVKIGAGLNFGKTCDFLDTRYFHTTVPNHSISRILEIKRIQNWILVNINAKSCRAIRPCDSCRKRKACCVMNATAAGAGSCTVCKTRGDICAFTEAVPKRRNVRSPGHRVPNEALSSPRLGCFGAIAPENCPRFGDDKTGQLDGWRNNLPSSLQVAYQVISWLCPNGWSNSPTEVITRAHQWKGYLHLSFFTVKITLSCRLIRPTKITA
jgi:hypothetical protein